MFPAIKTAGCFAHPRAALVPCMRRITYSSRLPDRGLFTIYFNLPLAGRLVTNQIAATGAPAMASVLESPPAGHGLFTATALVADSDPAEGVGAAAAAAADAASIAEPAPTKGAFEESWSLSNQ